MKALDFLIRLAACAGKPGLDFQYGENDFGVAGWKLFLGPACAERAKVELSLATGSSWYAFSTLGKDAAPEDVAEDMLARITRQPDEPVIIKVVSALTGAAVISALWDTYNETADALAAKCQHGARSPEVHQAAPDREAAVFRECRAGIRRRRLQRRPVPEVRERVKSRSSKPPGLDRRSRTALRQAEMDKT